MENTFFRARNKIIFRFVETPQNSDFLISTRKPLGIHEPMLRGFVTNIMQLLTNIALEKYPFMQNTVVLWQRRINNNLSTHLLHYHHVSHVPNFDSKYKRNGNNKITYISNRHVLSEYSPNEYRMHGVFWCINCTAWSAGSREFCYNPIN